MTQRILDAAVEAYRECPGVRAVVLGGSLATGTATDASDVDIGLYYDRERLDYGALNDAARRLDDAHREDLICREGGWGGWVNCGGWLTVQGRPVDVILRDWRRVQDVVQATDRGAFACHYQPGHPHAFVDAAYRGELACCRTLYARDGGFEAVKRRAEVYPPVLRRALVDFFLFEADFSCALAEKYAAGMDAYYLAGHLFRAISALNQVLFALNGTWLLNEKKAVQRAGGLPLAPADYATSVQAVFTAPCGRASALLRALQAQVSALAASGG